MSSSPQRPDESPAPTLSNSILRPSVLSGRLPVIEAEVKSSEPEPSTSLSKHLFEAPKFTPTEPVQAAIEVSNSSSVSSSGFIFGQNMGSRVVNANQGASKNIWQAVASETQYTDQKESCGSVFTTLAKAVAKQKTEKEPSAELLEDSALALVNKRNAVQLSLNSATEEHDGKKHGIITGEEDECTLLELTCSAYVFNRDSKQWKTIGQSYLHLNDPSNSSTDAHSRLIIRLQSTRKVVVNTRIWPGMPVALVPENKAVRIGALALAEPGSEGGGEDNKVGIIRTYMLKLGSVDTARQLYDALLKRTGSVQQVDVGRKRVHFLEEQNSPPESSPVPVKVIINSSTNSQETSDSLEEQLEEADNTNGAASPTTDSPPRSTADLPIELTAFSFRCEHLTITTSYSNFRTELNAASTDPPNNLMANLIDFPRSGTSVIEVSCGSGVPCLTTSINEHLAFCRYGDCELRLFCAVPTSDSENENSNQDSSDNVEGGEGIKICRIVLTSSADSEKLYRSLLMRAGRHFLRAVGLLKEREGQSKGERAEEASLSEQT